MSVSTEQVIQQDQIKEINLNEQEDEQNKRPTFKDLTNSNKNLLQESQKQKELTKQHMASLLQQIVSDNNNKCEEKVSTSSNNHIVIKESISQNTCQESQKDTVIEETNKENMQGNQQPNSVPVNSGKLNNYIPPSISYTASQNNSKPEAPVKYSTLGQIRQNLKAQSNQQLKQLKNMSMVHPHQKFSNLLEVNLNKLNFGLVLPGNIFEESLKIRNLTNETLSVDVFVECCHEQLALLDEYVYSVRTSQEYNYNEKQVGRIGPQETIQFKVALKVPNINEKTNIDGKVLISINNVKERLTIPILSTVEMPKIICQKSLLNKEFNQSIIKIAIKKGKKSDSKIPLKNLYNGTVTLEFDWLKFQVEDERQPYSLHFNPQQITVQPQQVFIVNTLLKINPEMLSETQQPAVLRKVLIVRIKNSSIVFSFPIELEIF